MIWWGKSGGEGVGVAEAGWKLLQESWFDSHPGPQAVPAGWVPTGERGPLSVSGSCWSWNGYLQLGHILTSTPASTWLR